MNPRPIAIEPQTNSSFQVEVPGDVVLRNFVTLLFKFFAVASTWSQTVSDVVHHQKDGALFHSRSFVPHGPPLHRSLHQPHFAPPPRPTTTVAPILPLLLLLLPLPLVRTSLPPSPSFRRHYRHHRHVAGTLRRRRRRDCCCELPLLPLHSLLLSVACVIHSHTFSCFSSLPPRCMVVCF